LSSLSSLGFVSFCPHTHRPPQICLPSISNLHRMWSCFPFSSLFGSFQKMAFNFIVISLNPLFYWFIACMFLIVFPWFLISSLYEGRLFVCLFCLSCWDLPNHGASFHTFGTVGKPLMTRGYWFDFIMFQPMVEKFLNTKHYRGILVDSQYCWKPLNE